MSSVSSLPTWALYVQACGPTIGALAIAIIASTIQWRQWRTANDKVRLDLLERRLSVYNELGGSLDLKSQDAALKSVIDLLTKLEIGEMLFPRHIYVKTQEATDFLNNDVLPAVLNHEDDTIVEVRVLTIDFYQRAWTAKLDLRRFMSVTN